MSMTRLSLAIAWLLPLGPLLAGGPAYAQSDDGQPDIFFADKVSDEEQQGETPTKTLIQGSLTSSTFAFAESGGADASAANPAQQVDNASPVTRLYTDLRVQLDAKHIKGGRWDLHVDGRVRLAPECSFRSYEAEGSLLTPELQQHVFGTCRSQSGVFGTNEYDAREVYLRRTGSKLDLYFGRQFVPELAAIKIDGIRGQYYKSEKWSYIGAGGLYPARGSRSIDTDYPLQQRMPVQLDMPVEVGPRIMPVAGGAAAAYRYPRAYGALGMVGILPLADEFVSGLPEVPRIFITDSGYLRYSSKLDLYHFAVVDLQGSAGAGLTNLSAGVNYRPVPALRVTAGYNKVDTETLNVIAQQYLDVSQTGALPGSYQNNAEVARISSHTYRLGVSAALKEQRFEISVSGQLRERPEIQLTAIDGVTPLPLPAARAADIQLSVVDRRSIKGLRLSGSFLRIMGVGEVNLRRSTANIFNLGAARSFKGGKGQFEANITYLSSDDEDRGVLCADVITCYGTSHVGSLSLGGTVFYRFKTDWFAVGDANLGRQTLTNVRNMVGTEQPANTLLSAFIRVAYRF